MKLQYFPLILLVLISAACFRPKETTGAQVDHAKFEPVYRAAKSIQAAISVGLNYQKMGELLQNFATEILIAKDKAESDMERLLVARYGEALPIFKDSLALWNEQIDSSKYEWLKGYLVCEGDVAVIAGKYKLQKEEKDLAGVGRKLPVIPVSSVQALWLQADLKLQEGNKIYNAKIGQK
ncbi:MAG: hypothetical protein LAP85_27430 [Acidobacteriia bacterium]|nr:hypothetical protein [Terriglobia bacterium]